MAGSGVGNGGAAARTARVSTRETAGFCTPLSLLLLVGFRSDSAEKPVLLLFNALRGVLDKRSAQEHHQHRQINDRKLSRGSARDMLGCEREGGREAFAFALSMRLLDTAAQSRPG